MLDSLVGTTSAWLSRGSRFDPGLVFSPTQIELLYISSYVDRVRSRFDPEFDRTLFAGHRAQKLRGI